MKGVERILQFVLASVSTAFLLKRLSPDVCDLLPVGGHFLRSVCLSLTLEGLIGGWFPTKLISEALHTMAR